MARPRFLILAACAALSLAACATDGVAPPGPVTTPAPAVLVVAKVQYGFEATYNLAARLYLTAAPHLSPEVKAQAKDILARAYAAVRAARAAIKLGDATTVAAQVNLITELCAQVATLIHGAGQ
jgi:hypothetical protein